MNLVHLGLAALLPTTGLAMLTALAPARWRSAAAGTASAVLGLFAALAGVAALTGGTGRIALTTGLPEQVGALVLAPSRLGGLFMVVAGLVGALAAWFGIGYAHGSAAGRTQWAAYPLFLLGMVLVPAADDVLTFLLAWELMAAGSTVLVMAEHAARPAVRGAALWYAVMTHLSFLLLLAGFSVLAGRAGTTDFAGIARAAIGGGTANIAFLLLVAGFATKAGLVPLHVWLPRAHPQAPSHVSAAMSAAMVKMGVYGMLLLLLRLLPPGPGWWAVLLLALGAVSALYGILQASVTSDLKRLLAYSTTENVGLVVTALAVSLILRQAGRTAVADAALVAALLLVVSHAAFKTVLFLGAGSVLAATGERDLDRLGGLGRRMPVTAWTVGVAALGAAALPVSSGFVAEWVLLQSLVHGATTGSRLVAVTLPVTMAVVALTAGLALLTFVKLVGIAFLARPRSAGAADARETSGTVRTALLLGAGAVLALGLLPGLVVPSLAAAVGAGAVERAGLAGVRLTALPALLDPLALTVVAAALVLPVAAVVVGVARRRPRRTVDLPWGCGGARLDPRMQYTATSYAEPLVRVFDDALRPARDLHVSPIEESRYLTQTVEFQQRVTDRVEVRLYRPVVRGLTRAGDLARRVQNGSIHRYLGYSMAALLVVLLAVTW